MELAAVAGSGRAAWAGPASRSIGAGRGSCEVLLTRRDDAHMVRPLSLRRTRRFGTGPLPAAPGAPYTSAKVDPGASLTHPERNRSLRTLTPTPGATDGPVAQR